MTATLQFNLPEETEEHLDCLHGAEWRFIFAELCNQLRDYQKYGHGFADVEACLEEVRTIAHSLVADRGLTLH